MFDLKNFFRSQSQTIPTLPRTPSTSPNAAVRSRGTGPSTRTSTPSCPTTTSCPDTSRRRTSSPSSPRSAKVGRNFSLSMPNKLDVPSFLRKRHRINELKNVPFSFPFYSRSFPFYSLYFFLLKDTEIELSNAFNKTIHASQQMLCSLFLIEILRNLTIRKVKRMKYSVCYNLFVQGNITTLCFLDELCYSSVIIIA